MRNLKISTKFFILTILIVLGFTVTIGLTWYMVNKNLALSHESKVAGETSSIINQLDEEILSIRISAEEFATKKDLKYVSKIQKVTDKLLKEIDDILKRNINEKMKSNLNALKSILLSWEREFSKYVGVQKEIGLTEKEGLRKKFSENIRKVEDYLRIVRDDKLLAKILYLRTLEKDFLITKEKKYLDSFDKRIKFYIKMKLIPEEMRETFANYQKSFDELANKLYEAERLSKEEKAVFEKIFPIIDSLVSQATRIVTENERIFRENQKTLIKNILLIGIFVTFIVIILIFSLSLNIIAPINKVISLLKDIAQGEGDLTQRLPEGKDEMGELGKWFNLFVEKIRNIIIKVEESAKGLNNATVNISNEAKRLSDSIQSLASTAEETSATVEEITSSIEEVAKNAQDIAHSSDELAESAELVMNDSKKIEKTAEIVLNNSKMVGDAIEKLKTSIEKTAQFSEESKKIAEEAETHRIQGETAIKETIKGMTNIKIKVEDIVNIVNELGKSSEEIGKIIEVISEITEQTNLLALNAAIEAARAGDAGKGFAVVADEIRKLAEKSQQAAGEIENLIRGIQKEVRNAVRSSDEGKQEVEKGMNLARDTYNTFQLISKGITNITSIIETIAQNAVYEKQQGDNAEKLIHESIKSTEDISSLIEKEVENAEMMGERVKEVTQNVSYISAAT